MVRFGQCMHSQCDRMSLLVQTFSGLSCCCGLHYGIGHCMEACDCRDSPCKQSLSSRVINLYT